MKKLLVVILVAFIIIQFFPIDKTNPPIDKGMDFVEIKKTPDNISSLLKTSCYDCHSHETTYPWYSNIAPASWFLQNHIKEGRRKFNFSTFAMYDTKRQIHKMEECVEMIEKRKMPLESYYIGHQDAKLTDEQRVELVNYFKREIKETKMKMP